MLYMIATWLLYFVLALATAVVALLVYGLYIRPRLHPASTCPEFPPLSKAKDILKRGLKLKQLPRQADVVVIGSGPSGLSAAVLLARQGKKVVVLEQHDRAGGGLHTFEEKGFEFDTGFHYVGEMWEGSPLRLIVDSLTGGHVAFQATKTCPIEPGVFDELEFIDYPNKDGKNNVFKVRAGAQNWINDLKEKFPEESAGIDAYLEDLRITAKGFLLYQIWRSFPPWLRRLLWFLPKGMHHVTGHTGREGFGRYTQNQSLIAHLSYLSLGCMAVPPAELDHSLNTGLHLHFLDGGYYPVGGPSEIARGLVQEIEKAGGRVFVRASVEQILVDSGTGKVVGVQLAKKEKKVPVVINAPVVVSSAGLNTTTKKLLHPRHVSKDTADKIASLELCDGHLFAFFGLEGESTELNLPRKNHWILSGTDLDGGMARFQSGGRDTKGAEDQKVSGFHPAAEANFSDDPPPFGYCGLAFTSTKDPTYNQRHPGTTTAGIIAGDVPYEWFERWAGLKVHKRGDAYKMFKAKIADRLKRVLLDRYPHLEDRIRYFDVGTPLDVNYYLGRTRGESYGLKMTPAKTSADQTWLFPKLDGTPQGLYFIGQDVSSDGFAPAIISALMGLATIDGPLWWLNLVPLFGGLINTLRVITAPPPV